MIGYILYFFELEKAHTLYSYINSALRFVILAIEIKRSLNIFFYGKYTYLILKFTRSNEKASKINFRDESSIL